MNEWQTWRHEVVAAIRSEFREQFSSIEDHDIDWKAIDKIYRSPAERKALLDQVSRAFAVGIVATPTIIINGQRMGYGESEYALTAVKQALGEK